MEIKIGPYEILQRTEYSKIKVFDKQINKDISDIASGIGKQILEEYYKQTLYPEDYFKIEGNDFLGLKESAAEENIKFLFIPNGVNKIKGGAFENIEVEYIGLPPSLTTIDVQAFFKCRNLKYIDIPDTVKNIGSAAFKSCHALEEVNLPYGIDLIAKNLFYDCFSLRKINIPASVNRILDSAFYKCYSLESVILPEKIEKIDNFAFGCCCSLTKINIPESIKEIGRSCFENVDLEEIIIPNSVEQMDSFVFYGCDNIEYIKLSEQLETLPYGAFGKCINLKNITLPDSILTLCGSAFLETESLKNVNIPRNLINIGFNIFFKSNIETLTFNYDLDHLCAMDCEYCYDLIYNSNINKIIINNNVKTITPDAFKYSGSQITSIDYLGTQEEFDKFKENNRLLFDKYLTNIREVNIIYKEEYKEIER